MRLHPRNRIVQHQRESWQHHLVEGILKILRHVISHLPNAMKGSISDLRVWVLQVIYYSRDHWRDLLDIIQVLTNLRESHETGIFVAPVIVVSKGVLH